MAGRGLWCTLAAVAAAAYPLTLAVGQGLPGAAALHAVIAILATQLVPGMLIWRCLRRVDGWWPVDVGMGVPIGVTLAIAVQVPAGWFAMPWLSSAVGPAVAVLLLALPPTRRRIAAARCHALSWWWMPLVGAASWAALGQIDSYLRSTPLTWTSGARVAQIDVYFHLALVGELAHRGPREFPHVQLEPLSYHWFSHAWVAQLATASGTGLDEALLRVMPAVVPLMLSLTVAAAAVSLSERSWTGPVAAILTMAGGDANPFARGMPGYPTTPLSPSLGLSAVLLVGAVAVVGMRWHGHTRWMAAALVPVLTLAAAGTKGSSAPLLVAGLATAAIAALLLNWRRLVPVMLDLATATGALAVAYWEVIGSTSGGLRLDFLAGVTMTDTFTVIGGPQDDPILAYSAAVTVIGMLARGAAIVGLFTRRHHLLDPFSWLLLGAGAAGVAASVMLYHPGQSQLYFARNAGPILALAGALGLAAFHDRFGSDRLLPVVALGAVFGPFAVLWPTRGIPLPNQAGLVAVQDAVIGCLLILGGIGLTAMLVLTRAHRFRIGLTTIAVAVTFGGITSFALTQVAFTRVPADQEVDPATPSAVTHDQLITARWLRDHSAPRELVMTNRHCTAPNTIYCDPRRFALSALTERRFLVEGWSYTPRSVQGGPLSRGSVFVPFWDAPLLALNDNFIARPDADDAWQLYERGVRWVLVDRTQAGAAPDLRPWAVQEFRTATTAVFRLDPPAPAGD